MQSLALRAPITPTASNRTVGPGRAALAALLSSDLLLARVARVAGLFVLAMLGVWNVVEPLARIFSPYSYRRDFLAMYTQVRAIAEGRDPLQPISDLTPRYIGMFTDFFPHPNPHPPSAGIIFLPLAWLDFRTAAIAWFVLQIACLAVTIGLLGRGIGRRLSPLLLAVFTIAAITWFPIKDDLIWGNVNLVILPLVVGVWLATKHERQGLAGGLLGLALLIKPVTWPVLLAFILYRRWAALRTSLLVGGVGALITGAIVGFDRLVGYVTRALPEVSELYKPGYWNISVGAQAWHLFSGGTAAPTAQGPGGIVDLPVLFSASAAQIGFVALPLIALALGVWAARSTRSATWSIVLLLALSVVINPISWDYYEVFLLLPLVLVAQHLITRRWRGWPSLLVAASASILVAAPWPVFESAVLFVSHLSSVDVAHPLSPFATVILTGPTCAVVGFIAAIAFVARREMAAEAIVEGPRGESAIASSWGETPGVETLRRMAIVDRYNEWIFRRLAAHVGRRVVEIGCGIGNMTGYFLGADQVTCLDVLPESVAEVRRVFADQPQVQALAADISRPGAAERVGPGRFDTAVCINVLEHIEDDQGALRHMRELLTPGGKLLLYVPASMLLYGQLDVALGHFRRYAKDSLRTLVESQGFDVVELDYMNALGMPGWFVSSRVLRRQVPPRGFLAAFNAIAPLLAALESRLRLPFGLSLVCIARRAN